MDRSRGLVSRGREFESHLMLDGCKVLDWKKNNSQIGTTPKNKNKRGRNPLIISKSWKFNNNIIKDVFKKFRFSFDLVRYRDGFPKLNLEHFFRTMRQNLRFLKNFGSKILSSCRWIRNVILQNKITTVFKSTVF